MLNHERAIHLKEKPFKCSICSKVNILFLFSQFIFYFNNKVTRLTKILRFCIFRLSIIELTCYSIKRLINLIRYSSLKRKWCVKLCGIISFLQFVAFFQSDKGNSCCTSTNGPINEEETAGDNEEKNNFLFEKWKKLFNLECSVVCERLFDETIHHPWCLICSDWIGFMF